MDAANGNLKQLPEDDAEREKALAPYRYTAKTLMMGEGKLREFVLGGDPADKEEMAAGIEAWAGVLYAYGFNPLHPLFAFYVFQATFLGPDLIKNREKILSAFKKKVPGAKASQQTVEVRMPGPGVAPEVKVTEQSTGQLREVQGQRVA